MTATTYRDAIAMALRDELRADDAVVLLGEDIGGAGGVFKTTDGLFAEFGAERVRDTPISEIAIVGAALGAALNGMRPVVDLMFADFAASAMDQLAIEIPKYRYMTGGQAPVPLVVRAAAGGGLGFGAQHSGCPEAWFLHTPGWRVVTPATAQDAYSLLRAAVRSDDPVLFLEHKALYGRRGELDAGEAGTIGSAAVRRAGEDVTIVANLLMVERSLDAADRLAANGVSAEVIDVRSIAPLDVAAVLTSVARTGRLVTVEESPGPGGWGAEMLARIAERALDSLDGVCRVTGAPTPVPYAPSLEERWLPSPERIASAARRLVRGGEA
jgi:pyruvate dehydrogenase E1 component beta subunit